MPGTSRALYGREENPLNDKISDRLENIIGSFEDYNNEGKDAVKKERKEKSPEGKDGAWTNNKIREIEDTLGTLGSLIDEYRVSNNNESDTETEHGHGKMEIEQDRIGKRKKESSPENKEDITKDDSEDNTRPVKRASVKSKIDTSLPIYKIDSSSNEEETSEVEFTGIKTGSERKRTRTIKTPKRKTARSLDMSIREISQTEGYGKYENMTAPKIGSVAIEWLNDIELIRKKCGNIQGRLSGHIKDRVAGIKEIIKNLIRKAECKGDPSILRTRNVKLTADLKALKGENESRKKETEMLKRIIEDLKKEVLDLKRERERDNRTHRKYETQRLEDTEYDSSTPAETTRWENRQSTSRHAILLNKLNNSKQRKSKERAGKVDTEPGRRLKMKIARRNDTTSGDTEHWIEGQKCYDEERRETYSTRSFIHESVDKNERKEKPLWKRDSRTKPKIIVKENIQIRPPFDERQEREPVEKRMEHIEKHLRATNNETTQKRVWETVTRRKNKNVRTAIAGNEGTIDYRTDNREKITDNRVRRRPPKSSGSGN